MGIVYVNAQKLERAQEILALISGTKVPQDQYQTERKDHYARLLNASKIKADDENALSFVYEKLGGLIRTEEEQAVFEEKVKVARRRKSVER